MISKANVRNYKSNQRVFEFDRWRYNNEKPTHIYLDYRIVISHYRAIERHWSRRNEYTLGESAGAHIRDLLTIAYNLGFRGDTADARLDMYGGRGNDSAWNPGQPQIFRCVYKGRNEVLFEVKAHLNGNLHFRLNQKFALALNVEYGRLKGWIHSKEQAAEEIKDGKAAEYFKTNFTMLQSPFLQIEQQPAEPEAPKKNTEGQAIETSETEKLVLAL
jgi:hypothetical protein